MGDALAMAGSLVMCQLRVVCESMFKSIALAGRLALEYVKAGHGEKNGSNAGEDSEHALYEGVVWHERKLPVRHQFEYKVRYALINLDKLPSWFSASSHHHMTADQARAIVGTSGNVFLLCMPTSVGYEQNPLSVYYCYDDIGSHGSCLAKTIAEVTNTPWGERVTFVFDPKNDTVAKPLHVSPFMDMQGSWRMHAPAPGEKLSLTIGVEHPHLGSYFVATLRARKVKNGQSPERFLWLMPQKVALWIYWQAIVLTLKGVAFVQHPKYVDGDLYRKRAKDRDAEQGSNVTAVNDREGGVSELRGCPRLFAWRDASGYPWL